MDEKASRKTYVEEPEIPAELEERLKMILAAQTGLISVTEAAQRVQLSRNHFQTLMHRALWAMVQELMPKPMGRPGKSEREKELEEQVQQLERKVTRLEDEAKSVDRILGVARELVQARTRTSRTKKEKAMSSDKSDEPDGMLMEKAERLRREGLGNRWIAAALAISESTLGRWRRKHRLGAPLRQRRGPGPKRVDPMRLVEAAEQVRAMRGCIGAEALSRTVCGLSRRICGGLKGAVLTEMERERKACAQRVWVSGPGVLRGMDAKVVPELDAYVLACADGAVPYRTTLAVTERYDGDAVLDVLERDIEENGAPLVYRVDRAKAHRVPEVLMMLGERRILMLSGPAHHPQYYGQLERQNREHEMWLSVAGPVDLAELKTECEAMQNGLNRLKRERLGWASAAARWQDRRSVEELRESLWDEVQDRVARNWRRDQSQASIEDVERLAIENALVSRGLLRVEAGGWC